jgi:hypothetical protein
VEFVHVSAYQWTLVERYPGSKSAGLVLKRGEGKEEFRCMGLIWG